QLTLEQAAQATRIRLHYLQALENDQFDMLPSETQGRGFLRLYADYLGIPSQPLLDAWSGIALVESNELPTATESPPKETPLRIISTKQEEAPSANNPNATQIPASKQILQDIGHKLQERRKALGLELSDVEDHIHVRVHHLQALEEARMEELPSLVQGRGMLHNYARFLDLDAEEIMLQFGEVLQSRRIELATNTPNRQKSSSRSALSRPATIWKRFVTPDLLIGGGMIIVLLLFVFWSISQVSALRGQTEQPAFASLRDIPTKETSVLPTNTPTFLITPQLVAADTNQNQELLQGANETTQLESTQAFSGTDPLQVYIIARQRAWMRVIADGKEAFLGRVKPGNAYPFSGKQQIEIQGGNAAALQIVFNQQDLGSLGITGQPVNLIFTIGGIITPTARFTVTPTTTQPATLTPQPTPTIQTPTVTPFVP
ncbi:MAG: RodZ domain-containing protein, partial [Anaerolineales bacterium]